MAESERRKVRVALIGAGGMASRYHHPSLASFPDVEIAAICDLVEMHAKFNVHSAARIMKMCEPFDVFWVEEPVPPEDVDAMAQLQHSINVPIALGESLHSPYEFERYVGEQAVEIVQIDPITNGGITASARALALADAAGLRTSSHYADELSAHLLCASRRPVYLEKHAFALDRYLAHLSQGGDDLRHIAAG